MDFLELNIHQRILSDIACNEDGSYAQQILSQKVEAHADLDAAREDEQETEEVETEPGESTERIFMSVSRVHCNIAFGELVVNFPIPQISSSIKTVIPVLVGILREIPTIDFDKSLSWEDWALPDQLVFSTISALLRIANEHPDHSGQATAAVFTFISQIIQNVHSSTSLDVLTQLMPALHGFYRAISSTSYQWNLSQWETLTLHLKKLCSSHSIERLNHLLVDILQKENADADTLRYVQTFITRYVNQGRPLSGYFMVCCVLETEWTVLAQALAPPISARSPLVEAAAANKAWLSLTRNAALELDVENENTKAVLKKTISYAMQCFTDLLSQIEEMDREPPIDTYAWETLSESLKLATICCLAQREIDEQLYTRILLLLSTESPISDNLVQEAALKATTVLVRSFPDIAGNMVIHLRRFITSPMPLFEFGFASESRAPPPLSAAAKCLALCIRLAPGDDLIMSNMYSLLNYIAATSKDIFDSGSIHTQNHPFNSHGRANVHSLETGLRGLSEDEKRLVGISTISAVTKLALEFKMEEVTRLTISMLLQRLPSAEPTVEAAIAYNLVDLALTAPRTAFTDIIRAFSAINRSANPDDPRFSNNMVLAAQTRLSQELHRRPELYEYYLVELLTLFADKGVAIQNLKIANHHVKTDDMIEQLASLLLPIDALLAHPDFNPHKGPSPEIIGLFRNTWFLCVLFGFTTDETKEWAAMDWLKPALTRIAVKTPSMVVEEAHDAVASDVEYNSVIRQEYANAVISKHRNYLTRYITYRASEIRYLSAGQVIFILTLHDIESMRSAAGYPSSLVSYFINDSLNNHSGLSACMESVIRDSINDLNFKASQQTLPKHLSPELHYLVVLTTHRIAKARDIASKYLNRLITSFPSLMCDPTLVFAILEVLTLLQRACENEYLDEYNPVYEFHSDRSRISLQLSDSYQVRNDILGQLKRNANTWFELALGRAPMELQSTLQSDYDLLAYLVSLPFGVASPSAVASGVDVWSWVIAERSEVEVALISEILSAWSNTIKQHKGLFSTSLNYEDPFYHPISYSPTDKESMDRAYAHARRVLTPHALVLQMLFSRLQAARYHRPGVMFLIQRLVLRSAQAFKTLSFIRIPVVLTIGFDYAERMRSLNLPLRLLTENEISRLSVWSNPTNDVKRGADIVGNMERTLLDTAWPGIVRTLWRLDPAVAVYLTERFKNPHIRYEVGKLVRSNTTDVLHIPEALSFLLGDRLDPHVRRDLKHLILWAPVPPIIANTYFERRFNSDPLVLQYAHRVLVQHPVELTFFFIPQIVQALRYDDLGYVARFIFETAKISQLFCHQIIWNMKANCYKDDAGEIEDPMKPVLDSMTNVVVRSLSGESRAFYDREFSFFNEVTSISGKLKPYVKKTKPEKKAKIDEEMAKITVDVGVYLPSNPDGVVIDIDKKSGRPLQSHAKTPFMATFKVRKERIEVDSDPDSLLNGEGLGVETRTEYDVLQQAIFKVGDDCRQDVLALQIIAMFKNIFTSIGLTLYLLPYRVTATGPGCGVIDVVPNSTSRDEMGRQKVNDLQDFFIAKYGGQDTTSFQKARLNFIQSMAAYSVACYILQIKDRHNGNIMIDGEGHIVHIGQPFRVFLRPGGVKFEPSSFKLNHEMVVLMGGRYSQAIRPYAEQIVDTVQLMLDSGLPSFKGEPTIRRLRDRFALHLNERQAADYMMGIIRNAHENVRSTAYDEFQRLQNGIPYK
ncbi:hypothetical protein NLJ89_g2774 [Agrocybe chaxingu]|uniref:1-phosphatidylinositol 4-kinase n=1 Tax=Agrocybe chaxingu TaxID=84603 RepID=A0A9W8K3R0_9AGAR|nr:hypothetical protein NLJ89_g2774 [Agrocybe chaxingu]